MENLLPYPLARHSSASQDPMMKIKTCTPMFLRMVNHVVTSNLNKKHFILGEMNMCNYITLARYSRPEPLRDTKTDSGFNESCSAL